jgi:nucleotide-binding universal stress UspA family protein
MTAKAPGPVAVGVTGVGENSAALRFAAEEARRLSVPMLLVHAAHQVLPPKPPDAVLVTYQNLEEVAEAILKDVSEECLEIAEEVPIETAARYERPVDALVGVSEDAAMLVLQHRSTGSLRRIVTGSTSVALIARSHCPVVSVPEGWSPGRWGRVTVGVDEEGGPAHVLGMAFAEATAREESVTVLHGWRLDRPYADLVGRSVPSAWERAAREQLEDAVAPWRSSYPEVVEVDIKILHQWVADALVEESGTSDLLVLGRRSTRSPVHVLGSLARTLVGRSRCPVEVVPEPEEVWQLSSLGTPPQG